MPKHNNEPRVEYINVHRVIGTKLVIDFLRLSDPRKTEGLFFQAKREGQSEFVFQGIEHVLTKQNDGSFLVAPKDLREFSTEEFA